MVIVAGGSYIQKRYTCVHCGRRTKKREDYTPDDDSVCKVCDAAFKASGTKQKASRPRPSRASQKRTSAKKGVTRK